MMTRLVVVVLVLISIAVVDSLSLSGKVRLASLVSSISILGLGHPVLATTYTGTVSIADNAVPSTGALYITTRQDVGLWEAGVRNYKPPPIMAKKIPIENVNVFPLKVSLDDTIDITEEGKTLNWRSGKKPLLFSARLDTDSNANTRSADDLVGQQANIRYEDGAFQSFEITLNGRGGLGKVIVSK